MVAASPGITGEAHSVEFGGACTRPREIQAGPSNCAAVPSGDRWVSGSLSLVLPHGASPDGAYRYSELRSASELTFDRLKGGRDGRPDFGEWVQRARFDRDARAQCDSSRTHRSSNLPDASCETVGWPDIRYRDCERVSVGRQLNRPHTRGRRGLRARWRTPTVVLGADDDRFRPPTGHCDRPRHPSGDRG